LQIYGGGLMSKRDTKNSGKHVKACGKNNGRNADLCGR